jgi:hypothetical protein
MRMRSLLLLILPALLAFPAQAQNFDIQTDTVRIRMDQAGGIQIDSLQGGSVVIPSHTLPVNRAAIGQPYPAPSMPVPSMPASLRSASPSGLRCTGDTQEMNQSNRSAGGVSQTYSSSTTSVCR